MQTSAELMERPRPERCFSCVSLRSQDRVVRLSSGLLLPVRYFLARQPGADFWSLIHRKNLFAGRPCFVQAPRTVRLGLSPHRFESLGECLYYLRLYKLKPNQFLISHSQAIKPVE